jgi:hypothetical protein
MPRRWLQVMNCEISEKTAKRIFVMAEGKLHEAQRAGMPMTPQTS